MEALKAQAVAARTYACRKMCEHAAESFDLYATVTDQVYGGVGSADSTADRAIRETSGLVAVYRDSLIYAFYHSTCGGRTAAVGDVWDHAPEPYLVSVDDSGPGGRPWCAASRYATWVCSWTRSELSAILARYGAEAACGGTVGGSVGRVKVEARTPCGRVARLRVESSRGSLELCGDKVRFGLRRGDPGNPILPSARFEVVSGETRGVLSLKGSGYGHGIGMCQMGALARAEAGQSFAEILQAYYPGVELRTAVVAGGVPAGERTR
jgi:stage II sporulation protein D